MALTYSQARDILANAGIPFDEAIELSAETEVAAALSRLSSTPLVLKANLESSTHKFRIGAVRLGCVDEHQIAQAISQMRQQLQPLQVEPLTFVLERQIAGQMDLILGANADPEFGPVIVFGAGGSGADHLADSAVEVLPFGPYGSRGLLGRTRVGRAILAGDVCDAEVLIDIVDRFADWFGKNWRTVSSVDINPLRVVSDKDVLALDARVVEYAGKEFA